jgi:hypothetical protein
MGSVKGLWPALGPPMVCFSGFQQGTPLLVIIILYKSYYSTDHEEFPRGIEEEWNDDDDV